MLIRRKFYNIGICKSVKFNRPVISVGNLTTGGTGKTPFECYLIDLCSQLELRVLLLSRGYGVSNSEPHVFKASDPKSEFDRPDEISMLALRYPELIIAYCSDRIAAYNLACQNYEFDMVILDDGFQHLKIKRDLDILILDAQRPYDSERLLPSGNLRESKTVQKHADLTIANHKFNKTQSDKISADFQAFYEISKIESLQSGQQINKSDYKPEKSGIISALGDVSSFETVLLNLGIEIADKYIFRDHHQFTKTDLDDILRKCQSAGITQLFTTEKDAVKLTKIYFEKPKIFVIKIDLRLIENNEPLKQRIKALAQHN